MMAAMGALVLALAPAFVRLSWPTRTAPRRAAPRPPGAAGRPVRVPLHRHPDLGHRRRDRQRRGHGRPALVSLRPADRRPDRGADQHEVAAVFGHEVGHVRHRHLAFFGFFFVASMGVLTLASDLVSGPGPQPGLGGLGGPAAADGGAGGGHPGAGRWRTSASVFGLLSRRFERQADVFGCRAVSCGRADCPPHPDLYARRPDGRPPADGPLCPVGIRIFVNALRNVAALNGMEPTAPVVAARQHRPAGSRSWKAWKASPWPSGGSRPASPGSGSRLALALIAGLVLAFRTGAIEHLGP